jgi:hypothetical protein
VKEKEDCSKEKMGKYMIYLPKAFAEDSMFPIKIADSVFVKISFKKGEESLLIEKWKSWNHHHFFYSLHSFP